MHGLRRLVGQPRPSSGSQSTGALSVQRDLCIELHRPRRQCRAVRHRTVTAKPPRDGEHEREPEHRRERRSSTLTWSPPTPPPARLGRLVGRQSRERLADTRPADQQFDLYLDLQRGRGQRHAVSDGVGRPSRPRRRVCRPRRAPSRAAPQRPSPGLPTCHGLHRLGRLVRIQGRERLTGHGRTHRKRDLRLTCTGPGGSATQSATVSVTAPAPTVTLSRVPARSPAAVARP